MGRATTGEPDEQEPEAQEIHASLRWATTSDGAKLALTRIRAEPDAAPRVPVILVHGSYTHRRFWVTEDGFGLAPFLAEHGYDVWIPELRGHGLSPKGEDFADVTAEDHIRRDLPTVHRYVRGETDAAPLLVGHSSGGLYLLGALSRGWIEPGSVQALAVFGTQISHGEEYLQNRLVAAAVRGLLDLLGSLPAPRLGLGPEVEPAAEMKEVVDWKAHQRWADRSGVSYYAGLDEVSIPFRSYAGASDERDPPAGCRNLFERVGSEDKSFQLLAESEGFVRDYGHAEMVASRAASREVWPDLLDWLQDHA